MLMRFADDMQEVKNGDLAAAFYFAVMNNKDISKFYVIEKFSLHSVIKHTDANPKFSEVMKEYLDAKK